MECNNQKYYTIGWYDSNIINLAKEGKLFKLGKNNSETEYTGGIVFLNLEEIINYCKKTNVTQFNNLSIFELKDILQTDIYKEIDNQYYLLNNKLMIYLGKYNELI